jgi:hypothetical protein
VYPEFSLNEIRAMHVLEKMTRARAVFWATQRPYCKGRLCAREMLHYLMSRPEHFADRGRFRLGRKNPDFFRVRKSRPCPSHGTCQASVFGPGSGRAWAWASRLRIL